MPSMCWYYYYNHWLHSLRDPSSTTSGNIEIDIVDTSGVTLQNRALAFMTTSDATDSNDILFEPGATFYTQGFKIENKGNIPVDFIRFSFRYSCGRCRQTLTLL